MCGRKSTVQCFPKMFYINKLWLKAKKQYFFPSVNSMCEVSSLHFTTCYCERWFKACLACSLLPAIRVSARNHWGSHFHLVFTDYCSNHWWGFKALIDSWKLKLKLLWVQSVAQPGPLVLYLGSKVFTAVCGNGLLISGGYLTEEWHCALCCKPIGQP